jgi:hypothetical protein
MAALASPHPIVDQIPQKSPRERRASFSKSDRFDAGQESCGAADRSWLFFG